jgi:glycopeptide antibiotics resistance protein
MIWEVFIGPYRSYGAVRRYNFYPFKTISDFLINSEKHGFHAVFINLAANIITFIPLGFFISMLVKKSRRLAYVLMYCLIIIIGVEIGQFTLNVGVLDVDDVILNSIGCILGLLTYKKVKRIFENKEYLF